MAAFIRSLDDIVGHKNVIPYIKQKLKDNSVPQVILFNGNPGLGKTSIAKVLAISLNGNKESLYKSVIDENKSTDCIKLFNMSSIGDETDVIIQELQNASFSSTGRKVIILDEVHGMTKKAQDAVLVTLEYLPDGIYVFMCTTEISMLKSSLLSRCMTFNLNNLSFNEIKQVIHNKIVSRGLTFDLSKNMVLNLIAVWSNNQPRMAINLLESFTPNSKVTQNELSAFIETNNIPIVITIVEYLYGSLSKGIEFVDSLSITSDLLQSLLEVLKIGLGNESNMVSANDSLRIVKILSENDITNYLDFVIKVNSYEVINKRIFTAKFVEHHTSVYRKSSLDLKPSTDIKSSMLSDMRTIGDNAIERLKNDSSLLSNSDRELQKDVSIEALFELGQPLIED